MSLLAQIGLITVPQEFSRLCNAVLIAEHGDDFLTIDDDRPDAGNDGYLKSERRLFAMHCFKRTQNQSIERLIKTKMTGDLGKARALRDAEIWDIERWTFIANYPIPHTIATELIELGRGWDLDISWRGPEHLSQLLARHPHVLDDFPSLTAADVAGRLAAIESSVVALGATDGMHSVESRRIARERPDAWEYLLYSEELRSRIASVEPKWRDLELGIKAVQNKRLDGDESLAALKGTTRRPIDLLANVNRMFDEDVQEAAFGAPGKPGDPEAIAHMAKVLVDAYEAFIDHTLDLRSLAVVPLAVEVRDLSARLVLGPIRQVRTFAEDLAAGLARVQDQLAARDSDEPSNEPIELVVTLLLEIEPADLPAQHAAACDRLDQAIADGRYWDDPDDE